MSGSILGRTAQSLKCLVADMCLTADPGFASLIPARSNTFREIADHGILISTTVLSLPLISEGFVVSFKLKSMCRKYWLTAKPSLLRK